MDESKKDMTERVARHHADQEFEHDSITNESATLTGAAGWNVFFPSLLSLFYVFFILAQIFHDFYFNVLSSFSRLIFSRLISRIEGFVWRGWKTSLLCLFRIV